jgi:peptidoglycan/xylan/chitin deacetylase (PgdA/CDA1 family)
MHKVPVLIQALFPGILWRLPVKEEMVFLTFDDGPHPNATPRILDILSRHNAPATFFCLGEHVLGNPKVFERMKNEGHGIGNHGFRHLSGWRTSRKNYIENAERGFELTGSLFFRPPFGHVGFFQKMDLQKKFKLVFWDIMAGDYNTEIPEEKCIRYILQHIRAGSILVMHDSKQTENRILNILPPLLDELTRKGFNFGVIGRESE